MILQVPALEAKGKKWPTLGPQVCAWIEEHLVFGPGDLLGQPAQLDEEKRFLIWRAYEVYPRGHEHAGRRRFKRVCFSLRKGSAKTELMAWLAAAEVGRDAPVRCDGFRRDGTPIGRPVSNPYIPLCAYTEEQTEELAYGALREILLRSKIAEQFDIGLERILRIGRDGREDGKVEAVASAPGARDGARTTMQGFDETHRFTLPSLRKAHQTMLQNIPKRRLSDAWSLETTTAYLPGENSVAEATHRYAKHVDEGRIKDSRLFFYHRQASDGHDLDVREQRRKAVEEASGPVAVWSSIDEITDQYAEPDCDRTYWERVWLNRPVKSSDRAFDPAEWAKLAKPDHVVPKGALITLGFDGSRYRDSTGLVGTEVETGHQFVLGVWERRPEDGDEWEVPAAEVDSAVALAFEWFNVFRMYADPPFWAEQVARWAGKYGDKKVVVFLTNRWLRMATAIQTFRSAQRDGSLSHDGNAAYARHIGNCHRQDISATDDQGQPHFVLVKGRKDSPEKIDLAMAGVLSWEARQAALTEGAGDPEPEPEVWVA